MWHQPVALARFRFGPAFTPTWRQSAALAIWSRHVGVNTGPNLNLTNFYSLYSTATQNTWCWELALGNAPDARILCWRYQHVGIFWRYLTLKFVFSPTPTPDASQWNIGCFGSQCKILALAMYISCFLCRFLLRLVPNANPISSGIWAYIFTSRWRGRGATLISKPRYHPVHPSF